MAIADVLLKVSRVFPPEITQELAFILLRKGIFLPKTSEKTYPQLETKLGNILLRNPIGIPAGMDKNATKMETILKMGCSFLEVGTITPNPQTGNPKPRLFRISSSQDLINRLGLNNSGALAAAKNLINRTDTACIGISAGYNSQSKNPMGDYQTVISSCGKFADFISLNVSCPNIHKIVDFEKPETISLLINNVQETRNSLDSNKPIYLKLSPDYPDTLLNEIVNAAMEKGIDGFIATNTTLTRPKGERGTYSQKGGLSGRSLFQLSTMVLAKIYKITQGKLPIIGVGGISNPDDAYEKIKAGANAIQLYTALTYQGASLIESICEGLCLRLEEEGYKAIHEVIGTSHEQWLE